ncbi:hypothetical protein A1O1_08766 [Capronia coronata CBS 617.96]|uniref:Major facilitator superfamily (MFS) profile domain-containing protein n=1 Tax=Capronia coronata CBS 617.96 TaxID=1182541 RepID=W9XG72_9EURO|nr:uncharacterized protein A1O1_08766 [Capronia coronata CBS 617.96]EXJ79502.1 hypothetical protein A1O1_08766 [Capronia coronata CBS 617.96]
MAQTVEMVVPSSVGVMTQSTMQEDETLPIIPLPTWKRSIILAVTSWMPLAATFSSTSLFTALPEIAAGLGTSSDVLTTSNAGVFLAMGISTLIWGPISTAAGRRTAYIGAALVLLLCSIGTALANNVEAFVALRVLGGLEGTFFMVSGQTIIADTFPPVQRGTAVGLFMAGTVVGPALGPCLGGIIITYTTWRTIFWLQSGMIGIGLASAVFVIPPAVRVDIDTNAVTVATTPLGIAAAFNPWNCLRLYVFPNLLFADLACGLLSWSQYSLLTAPRYLINPRFHLTLPLVSGLFYIAPAFGFLMGTICGGRFSDITVRKRILSRGYRLPQDRLYSGIVSFFVIVPIASLIYGWGLRYQVGGLALPIVSIIASGFGLMTAFSSMNTYCAEIMPTRRTEVMAGKYLIQYCFAAAGSASILQLINLIGIGWASSIGVLFSIIAGLLILCTARYGRDMQSWTESQLKRE